VKPSGCLCAPLHIKLHYLTFATKHPKFGEVSNRSNPCLARILGKGLLGGGDVLLSEAAYRRETTRAAGGKQAMYPEDYDKSLFTIHNQFADWIMDTSQAKVIVIIGGANVSSFIKRFPQAILVCRLGGKTSIAGRIYIL
jgi:hypothetical protein